MMIPALVFDHSTGLIPAIVQDSTSKKILMFAFMNEESFKKTLATKKITFYSRSRKQLWTKGETSGHFLELISWSHDCDRDSLLFTARALGPTCHLGTVSCFESSPDVSSELTVELTVEPQTSSQPHHSLTFLKELESTIQTRFLTSSPGKSYVASLVHLGLDKIIQKVGEEAVETVIAAKNANIEEFKNEAADLLFHYLVLLRAKGISLADITNVLERRKS